mmetsp:Transcript_26406/g.67179  ORF Transcript_26406/g.67179 Transcript_26406/m.67179 type:complete len:471 (-) Transcript_26406:548-1960(-)
MPVGHKSSHQVRVSYTANSHCPWLARSSCTVTRPNTDVRTRHRHIQRRTTHQNKYKQGQTTSAASARLLLPHPAAALQQDTKPDHHSPLHSPNDAPPVWGTTGLLARLTPAGAALHQEVVVNDGLLRDVVLAHGGAHPGQRARHDECEQRGERDVAQVHVHRQEEQRLVHVQPQLDAQEDRGGEGVEVVVHKHVVVQRGLGRQLHQHLRVRWVDDLRGVVALHVLDHPPEQRAHVVLGAQHGVVGLARALDKRHHLPLAHARVAGGLLHLAQHLLLVLLAHRVRDVDEEQLVVAQLLVVLVRGDEAAVGHQPLALLLQLVVQHPQRGVRVLRVVAAVQVVARVLVVQHDGGDVGQVHEVDEVGDGVGDVRVVHQLLEQVLAEVQHQEEGHLDAPPEDDAGGRVLVVVVVLSVGRDVARRLQVLAHQDHHQHEQREGRVREARGLQLRVLVGHHERAPRAQRRVLLAVALP